MAHGGRARRRWGGGTRCTGSLLNFNNWSDLAGTRVGGKGGDGGGHQRAVWEKTLVTRVGGWGEAWGGGPWRAGDGGGTKSSVGATKGALT